MLFQYSNQHSYSLYGLRRKDLLKMVSETEGYKNVDAILLFAGFEHEKYPFKQDSSFYYFTGIADPGVVLFIADGVTTLYVPQYATNRGQWVKSSIELVEGNARVLGVDCITELGDPCAGYTIAPGVSRTTHAKFLSDVQAYIQKGKRIGVLYKPEVGNFFEQSMLIEHLDRLVGGVISQSVDISPLIMGMRRKKDMHEIELMCKAIEATMSAHDNALYAIASGVRECEVQGVIEGTFISLGAQVAFPSIVAGGTNATVLHYTKNQDVLQAGETVVIDVGAQYESYCADITRTYPVSGIFTEEQKKLYLIVLEVQEYVASLAKPGMWLSNKAHPDQSLHHLARQFLQDYGYERYFPHGIGHFLGLDVHDVGDYQVPLQEGDVFTIEPGIYVPEKKLGIRIEDNYWLARDQLVCLSEQLPKKVEDIEQLMQEYQDEETDEFVA